MPSAPSPRVTDLLLAWSDGDRNALDELIPLVHAQLLQLARQYMRKEHADHTLESAALVNEAYLRMIEFGSVQWQNRAHFLAVAARLMRRILVDFARSKKVQKRGGGAVRVPLDQVSPLTSSSSYDVVSLDAALEALVALDSRRAKVVELRIFGGLTIEETAVALRISTDTVTRDWKLAKAWLARELDRQHPKPRSHDSA